MSKPKVFVSRIIPDRGLEMLRDKVHMAREHLRCGTDIASIKIKFINVEI